MRLISILGFRLRRVCGGRGEMGVLWRLFGIEGGTAGKGLIENGCSEGEVGRLELEWFSGVHFVEIDLGLVYFMSKWAWSSRP